MRNISIIFLIFFSNLIFCQEKLDNEREIENVNNYNVEKIKAKVDEITTIFGTLLTPKSDFDKILVIVSGTGKISQKAHNYLTIYLLENNIGVFKFDKRGVGKSTGEYNDQPKIYMSDFIEIYNELKKSKTIYNKKIGFLGHSLGGIITIQTIENNIKPDFLIQWSAPIGKPRYLLKFQIENGIKNYDKSIVGKTTKERIRALDYVFELIDKNPNKTALELWKIVKKESKKVNVNKKSLSNYLLPQNIEFARMDNTKTYKHIDFPVLVCIGENDILVDPIATENSIKIIDNKNIEFKLFKKLNHFLQESDSLEPNDWNINEKAKQYIVNWILNI